MKSHPTRAISAVRVAFFVLVAAILTYYLCCLEKSRERFASKRAQEVYSRAREVFEEGGGDARYSDYKKRVPGADPVQYSDVRRLFKEGTMSPHTVESVM